MAPCVSNLPIGLARGRNIRSVNSSPKRTPGRSPRQRTADCQPFRAILEFKTSSSPRPGSIVVRESRHVKEHFADRLTEAIERKQAPVCVGLDLQVDRFPPGLLSERDLIPNASGAMLPAGHCARAADALYDFGKDLIRLTAAHVPALKINIAFFEAYGLDGLRSYHRLIRKAHAAGLLVIGDVKRADIGHTSERYAVAHLTSACGLDDDEAVDAITVNPYFGFDSVLPFLLAAKSTGRGLFVLVQTSNPSAAEIQGLELPGGELVADRVGALTEQWASREGMIGASGYSCVGAVVSPRDLETTRRLRRSMPHCIFLVPGFGAQGRSAAEVAVCFADRGRGAIVNASRSVIYAHADPRYRDRYGDDWRRCIEQSCIDFVSEIRTVAGL